MWSKPEAALATVEEADDASDVISVAAAIAGAIARSLSGQPSAVDLDQQSERADAAGMPWLASLARSALALEIGAGVAPELVERERSGKEDGWANGLADVFLALGQLRAGMRAIDLDDALAWFEQVDAPVLQVWALAIAALAEARAGGSAAGSMARSARALSRSVVAPGPLAIASAALALVESEHATDHEAAALAVAYDTGLDLSAILVIAAAPSSPAGPSPAQSGDQGVDIKCLGGFSVRFDGQTIDLGGLKPRIRSLLRLLAMHAGRPVHREVLIDQLWPDEGDVKAGTRNLQVAISALRQALEPGVNRGESAFVVREGDGYRLAVGERGRIDIVTFASEIEAGRAARRTGRVHDAEAAFGRALDNYAGPLLSEEGSAEWVLAERDRLGHEAADAAQALAELALERDDAPAAAAAAERGLRIDGYRDSLWRVLIDASEAAGDLAAAKRAKHRYEVVLKDLEA